MHLEAAPLHHCGYGRHHDPQEGRALNPATHLLFPLTGREKTLQFPNAGGGMESRVTKHIVHIW